MSHDALMRWEWEGGAPDSVSERRARRPAENTDIRSQPTKRRRARSVASRSSKSSFHAAPPAESGASDV